MEISGVSSDSPVVTDGDVIVTNEGSKIDHIITKGEDLVVAAGSILTKVDKLLANVEEKRFERILQNMESLTANTNKVMTTLNDKNLGAAIGNMKTASDSMSRVTKRIEDGPGTLHALIYDQGLHEDLRSLVGGANRSKVLKFFIRESIKKNDDN